MLRSRILLSVAAGFVALCATTLAAQPNRWVTHPELVGKRAAGPTWLLWRGTLPDEVTSAGSLPVRIATDGKYWLYVDGVLVVREGGLKQGPTPTGLYADTVDLGGRLTQLGAASGGEVRIDVLTMHYGKDGFSHRDPRRAALLVERIDGAALDLDLRVVRHPGFALDTVGTQPNYRLPESNFVFDARRGEMAAAPSADFVAAVPLDTVLGPLRDRPIPQWKDFGLKPYTAAPPFPWTSQGDTLSVDLPYNAQVTPAFTIDAPEGGLRVEVRTDNYRGGGPPNVRFAYLTRPGRQTFEVPLWMNGHRVRYHFPPGVIVHGLSYRETGFHTERAGGFESSDQDLDRLWEKSARTLYVTMRDSYMDCPDRERAQWWGDVVIELGEAFYSFDDQSSLLARKGFEELLAWQRADSTLFSPVPAGNWNQELPMQMLASVGEYGLWTYFYFSGDTALVRASYPAVKRYLNVWHVDDRGLVVPRKGGWTWGDWGERKDLYLLYQGWYGLALRGFEKMARLQGLEADAEWAEQRQKRLKQAIESTFWRKPTGDQPGGYASPDFGFAPDDRVQALAVLNDWVGPDRYEVLRDNFSKVYQASPYMERYVLEAMLAMGHEREAVARMKARYRKMIDSELTTLWEGWGIGAEGFGGGTYNHAWSGGPLTLMSQRLAGLTPASPGWETFRLSPKLADLSHVSAYAPTAAGRLSISWTRRKHKVVGELNAPGSLAGELLLPEHGLLAGVRKVKIDGRRIDCRQASDGRRYNIPAGSKRIEIFTWRAARR